MTLHAIDQQLIRNMDIDGLKIPTVGVKFFGSDESIPDELTRYKPDGLTLTCCQAVRQAELGDPVLLTADTIGCVAAAISLGLVDRNQDTPLGESLVYTDIMKTQADHGTQFIPPTPRQFTEGTVYACKAVGRSDFALFGPEDSGRFKDQPTAHVAVEEMMAIQPATTQAVLFAPLDFESDWLTPDVIVMSVRPVELTRIVQAYQFQTGKRVNASLGGLRVLDSDLIARPYLTGEINISTYCLGARLIAKNGPNRMGIGIPTADFRLIAEGMEASQTGYPFPLYPGASDFQAN